MDDINLCPGCNTMKHLGTDGLCGRCSPPESEIDAILDNAYTSATSDGRLGGDTEYARKAFIISRKAALSRLIKAEVRRARQEQIMQDYLAFSQITGTDESEFIEVREELLADLEAGSGEAQ